MFNTPTVVRDKRLVWRGRTRIKLLGTYFNSCNILKMGKLRGCYFHSHLNVYMVNQDCTCKPSLFNSTTELFTLCYVMLCREVGLLRGGPLHLAIWVVLQYLIPLCLGTWWEFWLFYRRASLGHFLANSTLPLRGWIRLHGRDPLFGEQYAACHARRTLEVPVIYAIGGPRV